jgi:hypothetical protein
MRPIITDQTSVAHFSKIDLQVKNREQDTGGDTAVFVEVKRDDGNLETIPIILQAKRFVREYADISQANGEIYQFHTLRSYSLPSAYIFFQNSKYSRIKKPLPPLVKAVHAVEYSEHPKKTSALTDTLPLANYVLHLIATARTADRFPTAEDAVNAMATDVSPEDLINVIVISPKEDAEHRYQEAWMTYLVDNGYVQKEEPKGLDW